MAMATANIAPRHGPSTIPTVRSPVCRACPTTTDTVMTTTAITECTPRNRFRCKKYSGKANHTNSDPAQANDAHRAVTAASHTKERTRWVSGRTTSEPTPYRRPSTTAPHTTTHRAHLG